MSFSAYLRITTLNTGKVEIRVAFRRVAAGCGTATQANEHGRASEDNDMGALSNMLLLFDGMLGAHSSKTTSNHNGLVVASPVCNI